MKNEIPECTGARKVKNKLEKKVENVQEFNIQEIKVGLLPSKKYIYIFASMIVLQK